MKTIKWLISGNRNITYLVQKHLLEKELSQNNQGYIRKYLTLYNEKTNMWGNGLYGPKWISTTYTLLDLISLEAKTDQSMMDAYHKLRKEIVLAYTLNPKDKKTLDLCIVGMLLRLGAYMKVEESILKELIDFTLYTVNSDGAWNCFYNYRDYQTSSLHTTMNILEGLSEYTLNNYEYRMNEVKNVMDNANEFILKKNLFRSRRKKHVIQERFQKAHFPTRWFYDMYRALEYFVRMKVPYDVRMEEGLTIIKELLRKGPLPKGGTYAGKVHFKYDLDDYKRMNTLRALKIMKCYDQAFYQEIIQYDKFKK